MLGVKKLVILDTYNVLTADDSYNESRGISFLSYEYWVHNSSRDIFIKIGRGITIGGYTVENEQEALKRALFGSDWKRLISRTLNPSGTSFRGRIFQ